MQQRSRGTIEPESVSALIAVNTQLGQNEAARGLLVVARAPRRASVAGAAINSSSVSAGVSSAPPRPASAAPLRVPVEATVLDEQWSEKLGRHSEALRGYQVLSHVRLSHIISHFRLLVEMGIRTYTAISAWCGFILNTCSLLILIFF